LRIYRPFFRVTAASRFFMISALGSEQMVSPGCSGPGVYVDLGKLAIP
jgi:hypothetical protein